MHQCLVALGKRLACGYTPAFDQSDTSLHNALRRGARVVDWDGLENRCASDGTVGSNPTLSSRSPTMCERPTYPTEIMISLESVQTGVVRARLPSSRSARRFEYVRVPAVRMGHQALRIEYRRCRVKIQHCDKTTPCRMPNKSCA